MQYALKQEEGGGLKNIQRRMYGMGGGSNPFLLLIIIINI